MFSLKKNCSMNDLNKCHSRQSLFIVNFLRNCCAAFDFEFTLMLKQTGNRQEQIFGGRKKTPLGFSFKPLEKPQQRGLKVARNQTVVAWKKSKYIFCPYLKFPAPETNDHDARSVLTMRSSWDNLVLTSGTDSGEIRAMVRFTFDSNLYENLCSARTTYHVWQIKALQNG